MTLVLDYKQLDVSLRGHTMLTTSMGTDEKEDTYLIGGLGTAINIDGQETIRKLTQVSDQNVKKFKSIPTTLKYGRAYHIALPISYELAKESCYPKRNDEVPAKQEDSTYFQQKDSIIFKAIQELSGTKYDRT